MSQRWGEYGKKIFELCIKLFLSKIHLINLRFPIVFVSLSPLTSHRSDGRPVQSASHIPGGPVLPSVWRGGGSSLPGVSGKPQQSLITVWLMAAAGGQHRPHDRQEGSFSSVRGERGQRGWVHLQVALPTQISGPRPQVEFRGSSHLKPSHLSPPYWLSGVQGTAASHAG